MTTQTYYPHPKLKPVTAYPMSIRSRIDAERKICRRTIRELHAAGYEMRVHSGDEFETKRAETESGLMRALFNLDDAWLLVHHKGQRKAFGWVRFVFGNDGWDVVSDYTTNLEAVMDTITQYSRQFE